MKVHSIYFTGYEEKVEWRILRVNRLEEILEIDVVLSQSDNQTSHRLNMSFAEYDSFAHDFLKVHEQLCGFVTYTQADFHMTLTYHRLGHVSIEIGWKSQHTMTLQSDQSYLGRALASIGVYT